MTTCSQTGEYAKALAAGFGTDASSSRILAFKNKVWGPDWLMAAFTLLFRGRRGACLAREVAAASCK